MLKFETNGAFGKVVMNLPTSIKEITSEYLLAVTKEIVVADDYSLIGILYRESLGSVILANSQHKKNITTAIVPIFVKCGTTTTSYIYNLKCGEKIIIAPSDIAMGHHVTCPKNKITINNILEYCAGDKESCKNAIAISKDADPCYFLEFKLVPNCNIHGSYHDQSESFINPFVTITKEG